MIPHSHHGMVEQLLVLDMRANTIQTNFTAGEISPLMYSRTDTNKYQNGAAQLTNFIVRPQGGTCRRPGTQFISSAATGNYTRILPFVVSNNLAYILEFGAAYIRFYIDGSLVVNGMSTVTVTTPYAASDLDQLTIVQSADELFVAHPNYPPYVLSRLSNISWTFTQYVPLDGPYLDADTSGNQARIQVSSDVTTMVMTVNSTVISVSATTTVFSSGSVGKLIATGSSSQPLFQVGTYVDTEHVTGTYLGLDQWIQNAVGEIFTYNSSSHTIEASEGGVPIQNFNSGCVGLYIQDTNTGLWYVITSVYNPSIVVVTQVTLISGTFTFTNINFTTGSVGKYLEYLVDGVYYLSQILSYVSPTQVTVKVLPQIFVNSGEFDIAISGSTITSSYSAVFSITNIGLYVRSTATQAWSLITGYNTSSNCIGTALSVFQYAYPGVSMTLQDDRVIEATISFSTPILQFTDTGTQFRLQFASQWRSFTVTSVVSNTFASGTLNDYMPYDLINATNPYNDGWADTFCAGAWSPTNGYPAIVGLHDQRLIFANTQLQPSTVWFSQSADYMNMAPTEEDGTVIATDAINLTLASGNLDQITWIRSGQVLLLGTYSSEYLIDAPASGGISPSNIEATLQSSYGSLAPTVGYRFGVATIFLQRGGNKIREMLYQFQFNAFNSKDISIVSEHIMRIRGGAKYMAVQVDPIQLMWIVCNNGDLVSCTYDRDQEIVAFTSHTIAGGTVESIAVIPNTNRDDVYITVKRTINGSVVRYIEMINPIFDTQAGDTLNTMQFLDCSLTYVGSSTSTITGLTYLQGQSVWAVVNGVAQGPFTVSGGSITLTSAGTNVVVGLLYSSTLKPLSVESNTSIGTTQGKRKQITEITVRVKDALPFSHGPDLTHLTLIDAANFIEDLNDDATQGQIVTGDSRFSVDLSWDTQAQYFITQNQPYPLTILGLMPMSNTNE